MATFNPATVNPRKKWFTSRREALAVKAYRNETFHDYTVSVFKGVKGSKHPNMYYVGTYLEFINIY